MLSAVIRTEDRYPAMQLVLQPVHESFILLGPLVLEKGSLKIPRPQRIGDRTVSRRSEPSSRAALIGEQPNPWELLHPQDATSRHRGAEPGRLCGLLDQTSLLSPE
jgi:hypothetical protein